MMMLPSASRRLPCVCPCVHCPRVCCPLHGAVLVTVPVAMPVAMLVIILVFMLMMLVVMLVILPGW